MSRIAHNNDRFERLKPHYKRMANDLALKEFAKPVNERVQPEYVLDMIEFFQKTLTTK